MSEFDNQNGTDNTNGTGSPYGARPDYYQPNNNSYEGNQEPEQNTTYHYSYSRPNNNEESQNTNYYNPNNQQQTYYQPPVNDNQGYYTPDNNDNSDKPPKKSKAGKIILIVFIACIIIAICGLAGTGVSSYLKDGNTSSSTSQSEDTADDVTTNDSAAVATTDSDGNLTVAGVAEKCMDSCVGITVYSTQTNAYNYFYGYGSQSESSSEPTESGEGSGVIMSESNGKTYIMTAAHVISDGDSFTVTLNNGKEYDATMVAYDSQTDIGVLSIDETGLSVAEFANSDNLVVGEQVVAIGCPGGLEFMNSVTSGYVSALDRPISSSIGYNNKCIQTDAAINPGNSGGALFNMQGQVIGINSSKIASTEYEGMGFAVPSSTAVSTANSLIKSGYVEGRAKVGIEYNAISNFSNSSAIISALAEKGYKDAEGTMVIRTIDSSSDLANKDVKEYDMIVAINGETLTSKDVFTSVLADSKPGDTVKLTIARIENNEITISEVDCKLIEATN